MTKPNQELLLELSKLIRKREFRYKLKKYLLDQNVPEEQHDELIAEAKQLQQTQGVKTRRIIWSVAAVVFFVLFFFVLPVSVTNKAPFILSLFGAAILTICLALTYTGFGSWDEIFKENEEEEDSRHKALPFFIVPGIALLLIFNFHFSNTKSAEIGKNGVRTIGVIMDGSCLKSGRGSLCNVTVKFTTLNGTPVLVKEDIDELRFNSIHKGDEIELLYSKETPSVIELIIDDNDARRILHTQERDITLTDLLHLLDCDNSAADSLLSNISFRWKQGRESDEWIKTNDSRTFAIKSSPNSSIAYIFTWNHFEEKKITDQFASQGFTMIDADSNNPDIAYYDSELYLASCRELEGEKANALQRFEKRYLLQIQKK